MTELISLISVAVMGFALWRERRNSHNYMAAYRNATEDAARTAAQLSRLTDRDEKGRFVKRETGGAL